MFVCENKIRWAKNWKILKLFFEKYDRFQFYFTSRMNKKDSDNNTKFESENLRALVLVPKSGYNEV